MSRISEVLDRIKGVRKYTLSLVDAVPESQWFRQPAEGVTHVAWQVGHLAMAQYRLALGRGPRPDELSLGRAFLENGEDPFAETLSDYCLVLFNLDEFLYVE